MCSECADWFEFGERFTPCRPKHQRSPWWPAFLISAVVCGGFLLDDERKAVSCLCPNHRYGRRYKSADYLVPGTVTSFPLPFRCHFPSESETLSTLALLRPYILPSSGSLQRSGTDLLIVAIFFRRTDRWRFGDAASAVRPGDGHPSNCRGQFAFFVYANRGSAHVALRPETNVSRMNDRALGGRQTSTRQTEHRQ